MCFEIAIIVIIIIITAIITTGTSTPITRNKSYHTT